MTEFVPLIFGTVAALAIFLFFAVSEVSRRPARRGRRRSQERRPLIARYTWPASGRRPIRTTAIDDRISSAIGNAIRVLT